MKKLLSLPPNLVECFYDVQEVNKEEWFCTSDPIGHKLGSGGGTTWLLEECWRSWGKDGNFNEWLKEDKKILLHAGGQSRRLPSYAPSGKVLTPIPVFRWERGQKLNQNLLSLQIPLYEKIMDKAPDSVHTLIASGDVYIRSDKPLQPIPEADVICYGLWVDPQLAKNHGVFVSSREKPEELDFMLQKPTVEELGNLMKSHFFLMDIGIWLLSDRAVELLTRRSKSGGDLCFYDLYSDFGLTLGNNPKIKVKELNELKVVILPLPGGEFYHYGTSRELISSTVAVQNLVIDQRSIMHKKVKPHPAMFVQNAEVKTKLTAENSEVWIENSFIGENWKLSNRNIVTGVPENDWCISLSPEICVDVIPYAASEYIARPYGFNDAFKGALSDENTFFLGKPFGRWIEERELDINLFEEKSDLQLARIFPCCSSVKELGKVIRWMIAEPDLEEGKAIWLKSARLSADEISSFANLRRLQEQRKCFCARNWNVLADNFERSVFYQLNLKHAAEEFALYNLPLPGELPEDISLMTRIHDSMFRAEVLRMENNPFIEYEEKAFSLLRKGIQETILKKKQCPRRDVFADQIVWGRSPARIDLAGGWSDTPPYCLYAGGNVLNMAIELNGQPPLQVYIKPTKEYKIILRSIDLGKSEEIYTYDELKEFNKVGSPFSIPKAALAIAGFHPEFCEFIYPDLEHQLKEFGGGLELTLLAAIPAGSGLGTSSVLAATVLGSISDFCGLNWDKNDICQYTLVLEQLLTTGGGWQDQYGGVLQGIKFLQTNGGFGQAPLVKWLPDFLFTHDEYRSNHLLYYTGITRTAKNILSEIVRNLFLNSTEHLSLVAEMKAHTLNLYEVIQRGDFPEMGRLIGKTWEQNKALDTGTNPLEVEAIIDQIKDYCLGYKLPGAGGGGYLYMVAKDADAAIRIKEILTKNPPNSCARFVDMRLSDKGLQISRS